MAPKKDKYTDAHPENLTFDIGLREEISQALFDDLYSDGDGPIIMDEVLEAEKLQERDRSPNFDDVVDYFGWPTSADASIKPPHRFADNDEFLAALTAPGEAPADKRLNNFLGLIRQVPTMNPAGDFYNDIYATTPVLHRFHALMPDLAEPLQRVVEDILTRHSMDKSGRNAELSLGMNNEIISALRIAYTVMGRLAAVDDNRIQSALLGNSEPENSPDVTDAWSMLVR